MFHCDTVSIWMVALRRRFGRVPTTVISLHRPDLHQLAELPPALLPEFVRNCPVARKYLELLGALDWSHFPERPGGRAWPGPTPVPHAPFAAAYLVKLEEGKRRFGQLRTFLVEHPALVWVFGFSLTPSPAFPWGFDVEAFLPSRKHLGCMLRELDNAALQFLLTASIKRLAALLPADVVLGEEISLDTKHIIALVKENNPKVFARDRFDKSRQPKGRRWVGALQRIRGSNGFVPLVNPRPLVFRVGESAAFGLDVLFQPQAVNDLPGVKCHSGANVKTTVRPQKVPVRKQAIAKQRSAIACLRSPHPVPTSIGNRVRHELDRQSDEFWRVYRLRTAGERINSQALDLGIERPHQRNGRSIANLNTLIYVLINLNACAACVQTADAAHHKGHVWPDRLNSRRERPVPAPYCTRWMGDG